MNIVIIGSGVSAIMVAKTFLEYNYKVFLIDSENALDKDEIISLCEENPVGMGVLISEEFVGNR